MSHLVEDRVEESIVSANTGTGNMTLNGAKTSRVSFATAGAVNGTTFWGLIEHDTLPQWEMGLMTYLTGGIIQRSATGRKSSNSGSAVNFSAGAKTIGLIAPAAKIPYADNNGVFNFLGPVSIAGIREAIGTPTISAGALTLDVGSYSVFNVANNANVTSLTISGATVGKANAFDLRLTADGTLRTWTWPGSVGWPYGAPTHSTTNGLHDHYSFLSYDGGVSWEAYIIAQGY